jgi:hypothetical protein
MCWIGITEATGSIATTPRNEQLWLHINGFATYVVQL